MYTNSSKGEVCDWRYILPIEVAGDTVSSSNVVSLFIAAISQGLGSRLYNIRELCIEVNILLF